MMGDSYIIAIDFGTAFSGYAFSLTPSQAEAELRLTPWVSDSGTETAKTPTCILFDEHEEFLKFGYEAQTAYSKMRGEEARKHYFFEDFKMALYDKDLNRDLMIQAANKKEMKALKVFTSALCYMKDHALKTINDSISGSKLQASDFKWVLTVPAIWDPSAKQFMREAATEAGIVAKGNEDKLVIALEPEAASVWCKKLPADGFLTPKHEKDALDQCPGTQYIVVDCGGGTIDITVHEVVGEGKLKELHKVSGNDQGGQTVDRKFKEFLSEIFCYGVWDEYEKQYPSEVRRMMSDFTVFKKRDEDVDIICPHNLITLAQRKQNIERFFESVEGASWDDGTITITREKLRSFFDESLREITKSLKQILKKDLKIENILLVGGYAESQILRQHVIDRFGSKYNVLCPFNPQKAIVKGAVMFGRTPSVVESRKSAFTYAFDICQRFDASKHPVDKKFTNAEGEWCSDIFVKLVEVDEDVGCDETRQHILYPVEADQTSVVFRFYRTERENANYVDEEGIEKIGSFSVPSPNTSHGTNRQIKLEIKFGSTEMKATATDVDSGSVKSVELDFMRK